MNAKVHESAPEAAANEAAPASEFDSLLRAAPAREAAVLDTIDTASGLGVTPELSPSSAPGSTAATGTPAVGVLVGFIDAARVPLVTFNGQSGSAALAARSLIDLTAAHIGKNVVLLFEGGDATRPIIIGAIREGSENDLAPQPGTVEVDVDGRRMVVSAKEQLVLKCGQASITLTRAGKVLIEGTYVSSRSSGVQRIKGGSIQLN